jgi:hypothetical protein
MILCVDSDDDDDDDDSAGPSWGPFVSGAWYSNTSPKTASLHHKQE